MSNTSEISFFFLPIFDGYVLTYVFCFYNFDTIAHIFLNYLNNIFEIVNFISQYFNFKLKKICDVSLSYLL